MGSILSIANEHRELVLAEEYAPAHGGHLPDDPFWRSVERRFDLAVDTGHLARFEHNHPIITPLLEANLNVAKNHICPTLPVQIPAPIPIPVFPIPLPPPVPVMPPVSMPINLGTPPVPPVPGVPPMPPPYAAAPLPPVLITNPFPGLSGGPTVSAAVPEPSSALLFGLGIVIMGLVWRARR